MPKSNGLHRIDDDDDDDISLLNASVAKKRKGKKNTPTNESYTVAYTFLNGCAKIRQFLSSIKKKIGSFFCLTV